MTIDIGDVLATVFGKATDGVTSRLFTDQPQHSVVTGTTGTRSQTVPWLLLSILLLVVAHVSSVVGCADGAASVCTTPLRVPPDVTGRRPWAHHRIHRLPFRPSRPHRPHRPQRRP